MKWKPNLDLSLPSGVTALLLLVSVIVALALGGCAQAGDPGDAMLKYLQARAAADATVIRSLSCSAWEGQAVLEADSFRSMNAKLDSVTCKQTGTNGDYTIVHCDGQIVTTYNGDNRTWALGSYQMTQEDGQWKMCGQSK